MPLSPCERLAQAQAQLDALLSGKLTRVVETPQLGRVEYASCDAVDLNRQIAALKKECAASLGLDTSSYYRGPISMEVEP